MYMAWFKPMKHSKYFNEILCNFFVLPKENFKVVNSKYMHNSLRNCKNVGNFKTTLLYTNIILEGGNTKYVQIVLKIKAKNA